MKVLNTVKMRTAGSGGEASGRSRSRNCANPDLCAYQGPPSTHIMTDRAFYGQAAHRFLKISVICHSVTSLKYSAICRGVYPGGDPHLESHVNTAATVRVRRRLGNGPLATTAAIRLADQGSIGGS